MRYFFIFFVIPMSLFWGWYLLAYHDVGLGTPIFTRQAHDHVFGIYGQILGIDPDTIAPMVARACVVDGSILLAIIAFRRRKKIKSWLAEKKLFQPAAPSA